MGCRLLQQFYTNTPTCKYTRARTSGNTNQRSHANFNSPSRHQEFDIVCPRRPGVKWNTAIGDNGGFLFLMWTHALSCALKTHASFTLACIFINSTYSMCENVWNAPSYARSKHASFSKNERNAGQKCFWRKQAKNASRILLLLLFVEFGDQKRINVKKGEEESRKHNNSTPVFSE